MPSEPGVYAWFFTGLEGIVPTDSCVFHDGKFLMYVGIAPRRTPSNGKPPSTQRLRNRIRYHFRGNAEGSTLRLTLGCLLSERLGIELRRVGSGKRLTFGAGEARLSQWMDDHAFVAWSTSNEPWQVEHDLIKSTALPLNLDMNSHHPFHEVLTKCRRLAKARARELPVAS